MQPRPLRSLLAASLAVLVLLAAGAAAAQSFTWRDVRQEVTLQPDGTTLVKDERTLTAHGGDFQEAFLCILLERGQGVTLLEGSGAVGPGPGSEPFTQSCQGGTELVVRNSEPVSE